ncbi:MAG: phosphoribosylanthranilate isomerase [Hyphomicrobiales bacterium]|nr:phosphoribosylanthranilate isomerase [Hyphomicrobiales bacterium]
MKMHVKICGLKTPQTLEATIAAGADMAGFVFFAPSPRHLSLADAAALGQQAAGRIIKVALLVDAADEAISAVIAALKPDYLQLHGDETPRRVADIRRRMGVKVIKALKIAASEDLAVARAYDDADMLLLDAKPPKGAVLPGGNGLAFDWSILADSVLERPWLLSGGLHPGNVAEALQVTRARGVDVSSGVESAPGVKDVGKIDAFVQAARGVSAG